MKKLMIIIGLLLFMPSAMAEEPKIGVGLSEQLTFLTWSEFDTSTIMDSIVTQCEKIFPDENMTVDQCAVYERDMANRVYSGFNNKSDNPEIDLALKNIITRCVVAVDSKNFWWTAVVGCVTNTIKNLKSE